MNDFIVKILGECSNCKGELVGTSFTKQTTTGLILQVLCSKCHEVETTAKKFIADNKQAFDDLSKL